MGMLPLGPCTSTATEHVGTVLLRGRGSEAKLAFGYLSFVFSRAERPRQHHESEQ